MVMHSLILFYLLLLLLTIQITLSDVLVYKSWSEKYVEDFDAQESDLYPSIPSEGITGYLTITDPPTACTKVAPPPPGVATFGYQWIALIRRTKTGEDSCDFAVKIRNAYNANFSAVIVYNFNEEYLSMGPYEKNVGVPSTLIAHSSGLLLIQKYLYNITSVNGTPIYHVKVTPEPPFTFGPYLITFVSVIAFSFLGLAGFGCYLQRRRTRRHRLPRSALKQLRTKKFVRGDPWDVCAICLDDYEDGAKLRILPCEHAYHMKCIDPWLLENRRQCPVCKRYVFPDQENSDDEENNARPQARTLTEQTPLVSANNGNSGGDASRNQQVSGPQLLDSLGNGAQNVSFVSGDLSDDEKDLSFSSGPTTTAELVFARSSSNPRRYGSMNNSSLTSRNANFLNGSLGGITDNTNVSGRSMAEDISDSETTNENDEGMYSMTHVPEENPAFVNDEQSTNPNQTHL